MTNVRKPPPLPFADAERGQCRWCGETIYTSSGLVDRRTYWHRECRREHAMHVSPMTQRFELRHLPCAECSLDGDELQREGWQVDHRIPLWSAPPDWWYWGPENLQVLCTKCHTKKTQGEATKRAKGKRQAVKFGGKKRPVRMRDIDF